MPENIDSVDLNYTLGLGLSRGIIKSLISTYLEQCKEYDLLLKEYHTKQKWHELAGIAHKAKGSVSYFGLNKLTKTLKKIQLISEAFAFIELDEMKYSQKELSDPQISIYNKLQSQVLIRHEFKDDSEKKQFQPGEFEFLLQCVELFRKDKSHIQLSLLVEESLKMITQSVIEINIQKLQL